MSDDANVYAGRLYDDVRGWYGNADTKAQVVLGLVGGFTAFVDGAMFAKPQDLRAMLASFHPATWTALVLMTACLAGAVMSAIVCLRSRVYTRRQLEAFISAAQAHARQPELCAPQTMWFFQMVSALDEARFVSTLKSVDCAFEVEVLASQIRILSGNVRKKHRAVNA